MDKLDKEEVIARAGEVGANHANLAEAPSEFWQALIELIDLMREDCDKNSEES